LEAGATQIGPDGPVALALTVRRPPAASVEAVVKCDLAADSAALNCDGDSRFDVALSVVAQAAEQACPVLQSEARAVWQVIAALATCRAVHLGLW
jgi:hypothetical protein